MNREQLTYTCRPSLLGPSALRLGDDGLVLARWYGDQTIPWHTIRAVHRPRAHQAELELADGKRVPLPLHGDELPALIESISARCDAAVAELRELTHDGQALRDALGLEPGGAITEDPNPTAEWFGLVFSVLIWVCSLDPDMAGSWLLWLFFGVSAAWMAAGALKLLTSWRVDARGITARRLGRGWTVPWAELRACQWSLSGPFESAVTIHLYTRRDHHVVTAPRLRFERVAKAAVTIAAANGARFRMSQPAAPETALSLASPDDPSHDRGLSRTQH